MALRIKVELRLIHGEKTLITVALVNTGFEGERPEVLVPIKVAEALGLWPRLPFGAELKGFETPAGPVRMYYLDSAVEVTVLAHRTSQPIPCALIISEAEREVLLNDQLTGALGIAIEDPARGLWRFREEQLIQEGLSPQYW